MSYTGASAGQARKNVCANNGDCGIRLGDHAAPILEGNTCQENKEDGLSYYDSSAGEARNNSLFRNGRYGLYLSPGAVPQLWENRFAHNEGSDLQSEHDTAWPVQ